MMLAQFQSLYPKGSLISELVQIFQGKYIVRASVQIEGVTRATGLAAAETIEAAEDQARNRALMVLGMENTPQQKVTFPAQPTPQVETKPFNEPAYSAIKSPIKEEPVSTPSFPQEDIIAEPVKSDRQLLTTDIASTSKSDAYSQDFSSNFSTNHEIPIQFDSSRENLDTIFTKNSENPPLPEIPPSNVTPFTPRSHNSSEDIPTPTTTGRKKKKAEPVDLSDVIAKTDVELQRLGWTPEQGREYLIKTYGKRGRTLLTEEELYTFLQYLQSQPDPIAGF
jgi:hypothetical protein